MLPLLSVLNSLLVQTKLLLDEEGLGRTAFQHFEYSDELLFSLEVEFNCSIEDGLVEYFLLEEDAAAQGQYIFLVSNEGVIVELALGEGVEIVVIEDRLFQDYHKLIDAVHQVSHPRSRMGRVVVSLPDEVDEFAFQMEQHAFLVVEVFLQDHREL